MKEPELVISPFNSFRDFERAFNMFNSNGEVTIYGVDIKELKKIRPFSKGDWIVICFVFENRYNFFCAEVEEACYLGDEINLKKIKFT